MLRILGKFESVITGALLVMMTGVVLLASIELAWILIQDVLTPPLFLLEIDELLGVFGQFLLVLVGIELLHSMKLYLEDHEVHLEAVIAVAVIAVARKIVVVDPKTLPAGALLGQAALMLALALAYYLVRRTHRQHRATRQQAAAGGSE
jgi:uncharacterized membrane protein (DUF373 family)